MERADRPPRVGGPAVFAAVLLLGALFGLARASLPTRGADDRWPRCVLGLLVAARTRLPEWAGAAIAAVFASSMAMRMATNCRKPPARVPVVAGFHGRHVDRAALPGHRHGRGHAPAQAWLPRAAGLGVALYGVALLAA